MLNTRNLLLVAFLIAPRAWSVEIEEAWMRAMPPGQPTAAAYLTLYNPGDAPAILVAASSPLAARVEVHRSSQIDGMWRMRRLDKLEIPPGSRVTMGPGDVHLMLFEVSRSLREGESLPVTLQFDDGESASVEAEVRQLDAGGAHHHH